MSESTTTSKSCAVCGRSLLLGERTSAYVSREGQEVAVCELCKSRAESAGWLRPDDAGGPRKAEGGRRRRRKRGELLGGLLPRAEKERGRKRGAASRHDAAPQESADSGEPGEDGGLAKSPAAQPPAAAADRGRETRSAAGPDLHQAIAAFNASENRRTIAGLSRSLGAAKATAIAVRTASGHTGARLTVAWELAWYQWEIGPGKRGPQIRQVAKGETVDQLRAADRNWNLQMAEDGTLSRPPRSEP